MRKLAVLLAVASFACTPDTTAPPVSDSDVAPHLLAAFDPGNGAVVTRLEDGNIFFPTVDSKNDLLSIHYGSSASYEIFPGCPVPPFQEALSVTQVQTPKGKVLSQVSGETFVRVFDLAGFPANVFGCQDPIAQGPIKLHGVLESPGTAGHLSSNGVITNTADGSDVRLHHTVTLDGSFPAPGTVRLR